ncbi:hypothetical protein ACIBEA_44160 [Streptomyces sp. NPDC051555]|uniref:hypothetical protein n=1 Tax=Streptomyces sp. NPDC051555 TaxID=3365657 RepID=UPI0037ACD202
MLGLLAAGVFGAAVAQGIPVAVRRATRHRIRTVTDGQMHATVFFRLVAYEQRLRALARNSGRSELARAAAMLHRLLWDAAGLVPLAEHDEQARELLFGYGESLALLVDQAVEVERLEAAVESAICDERPLRMPANEPADLPEGLLPLAAVEEAARELEELGQGLRHARVVLNSTDTAGPIDDSTGGRHAR